MVSKRRVTNQILNAFDWVSEPEFDALGFWLPTLADDIALNVDDLALPLGIDWETIDLF